MCELGSFEWRTIWRLTIRRRRLIWSHSTLLLGIRSLIPLHALRIRSWRTNEKIEHGISEVMESRNASLAGAPALRRQASQNFAARLDRLDADCGSPRLFSSLVREYTEGLFTRRASPRLAIFLASACLIV